MRFMIFLTIVVRLTVSCKELNITKVEYRSTTMMGKTTVEITADSVVVSFNGRGEPTRSSRSTESSEWMSLAKAAPTRLDGDESHRDLGAPERENFSRAPTDD